MLLEVGQGDGEGAVLLCSDVSATAAACQRATDDEVLRRRVEAVCMRGRWFVTVVGCD